MCYVSMVYRFWELYKCDNINTPKIRLTNFWLGVYWDSWLRQMYSFRLASDIENVIQKNEKRHFIKLLPCSEADDLW
jgi:hypothetical protein